MYCDERYDHRSDNSVGMMMMMMILMTIVIIYSIT